MLNCHLSQGIANLLAALRAGVTVIDAAFCGLGGCPFALGATGNVATEDVIWTLDQMGVTTGIDLSRLVDVANDAARLPAGRAQHVVVVNKPLIAAATFSGADKNELLVALSFHRVLEAANKPN